MGRGSRTEKSDDLALLADSQDRRAGRAIEKFHFALLEVGAAMGLPRTDSALKGGGNLRLFLHSSRRSRDLDLDYLGNNFERFGDRVENVLKSTALVALLRVDGTELRNLTRPKDTDTVKRWKLALAAPGMEDAHTNVEYSNRPTIGAAVFERSDEALARRVGMRPVLVNHYPPIHAIEQKVGALAERSETQPRDVFDLDHLFRVYPAEFQQAALLPDVLRLAIPRVWELTDAEYEELVVAYLEEEVAPILGTEEAWESIQLRVATALEQRLKNLENR